MQDIAELRTARHDRTRTPCVDGCTVCLTPHGVVVQVSERTRAWLSRPGAGLRLGRHGALEAPQAPGLLAALFDRARTRGHALAALGRSQGLPVTLCCMRVDDGGLCLTVHAPELVQVDEGVLQTLFQLTPSEAQVAALLCDGLSPAQAAMQLDVQHNTVLTHIKRCLAKTGCSRQAQLVSLLLRSVARRTRAMPGNTPDLRGLGAARVPPDLFG